MLNFSGLAAALTAFLGIWLGHVMVRWIEFRALSLRPPMVVFCLLGAGCLTVSLAGADFVASAVPGILGITFLWDALECARQEKRVRRGHAPANPNNPRHARILASCPTATTIHWLERDPLGRSYTEAERQAIMEREQ